MIHGRRPGEPLVRWPPARKVLPHDGFAPRGLPEQIMPSRQSWLVVDEAISVPISELKIAAVRSSGPGGQNVNKVSSQIQLRWNVTETSALPEDVRERFVHQQRRRINRDGIFQLTSQRFRDQGKNREDCLDRLRDLLEKAAVVPEKRKKTRVPRRVKETRLREKRARSEKKRDRRPPPME